MKNRKTLVMGIIIAVLAITVIVMSYIIFSGRNSGNEHTVSENATGTAEGLDSSRDPGSDSAAQNDGKYTNSGDAAQNGGQDTNSGSTKSDDQAQASAGKESDGRQGTDQTGNTYYAVIGHESTWEANGKVCATENIDIYNMSDSAVPDWKLNVIYRGKPSIDQIWNSEYEIEGNTVVLTPMDYNKEISVGQSVNLGYNISSDDLEVVDYVLIIDGKEYRSAGVSDIKHTTDTDVSTENITEKGTPFENHGQLSLEGTHIIDKNGDVYQLKGVSTHGLTWFPDYVNKDAFETLRDDWGANLVRLAMYTDTGDNSGYCSGGDKEQIMHLVDSGVAAATELGMYVIIDWHILNDGDPNQHIDDAKDFFAQVSSKYAGTGNVLYEICNEPNGGTQWSRVKSYAEAVIPVIRENDKDALIIVGTPNWSQDVDIVSNDPVQGFDNIMYAVHFYAATHKDDLRQKVKTAIDNGLPLFVSEFSLCDASGNGAIDYDSSDAWFQLIEDNDLSYAAWSLCNKDETSALLKPDTGNVRDFADEDLSDTGRYVRDRILEK